MANFDRNLKKTRIGERSFSLIETVIALGLLVTFILEVTNAQGRAIYFSEYQQDVTKATWLAKSIMSKVEYEFYGRDFKELTWNAMGEQSFKDEDKQTDKFTYKLSIDDWKLPLTNFILNQNSKSEENAVSDPQSDFITQQIEAVLGDSLLKIARVEVFWPEGAVKNSTSLTLLLTNIRAIDAQIASMKPLPTSSRDKKQCIPNQSCKSWKNMSRCASWHPIFVMNGHRSLNGSIARKN